MLIFLLAIWVIGIWAIWDEEDLDSTKDKLFTIFWPLTLVMLLIWAVSHGRYFEYYFGE